MSRIPDLIAPAAKSGSEPESRAVRLAAHRYYKEHYASKSKRGASSARPPRGLTVEDVELALRRGVAERSSQG